jgi:hypothetical protein
VNPMVLARDLLLQGQFAEAREQVELAAAQWRAAGNLAEEARCLQVADALAGFDTGPERVAASATELAVAEENATAAGLAEVVERARQARADALATRSPMAYVAAAVIIAALAEFRGDLVEAYASLAVGWVTIGDLLGAKPARATFEPLLLAQRSRWGATQFATVKAEYERVRMGTR